MKDKIDQYKTNKDFLSKIKDYVDTYINANICHERTNKLINFLKSDNHLETINYTNIKILKFDEHNDVADMRSSIYVEIEQDTNKMIVIMTISHDKTFDKMYEEFFVSVNNIEVYQSYEILVDEIYEKIKNNNLEMLSCPIENNVIYKILLFCVKNI